MISLSQSIPEQTKKQATSGLFRQAKPKPVPVSPTIKDPTTLVDSLSDKEKRTLNYITYWLSYKGYCDSSIPQIASALSCAVSTVERALARLKQLKLIYVTQRFNQSNFTYLNPYITQNYTWYNAIAKFCEFLPRFVLSLSLLTSTAGVAGNMIKTNFEALSLRIKSFITTTTPLLDGYPTKPSKKEGEKTDEALVAKPVVVGVDKKVREMKQFDAAKGEQCAKIARALLRRGAKLTQDEIRNLLAYDTDVLERVSKAMRETKNIRNVSAFFFGLARKFQQEAGIQPDWDTVHRVRSLGIRLVTEEEINNPQVIAGEYKPAPDNAPQKGEGYRPSYAEQVRKTMAEEKAAAEARKGPQLSLDEKITETQATIVDLERLDGPAKQYAEIILEKVRRDLALLLAEREGAVEAEPAALQPMAFTQEDTKQMLANMKESDQIKAQDPERQRKLSQQSSSGQKSNLGASSFAKRTSSFVYDGEIEEIDNEEALYYSGQRDPFAETEGVSGADVR